jgi:hypothetical protein
MSDFFLPQMGDVLTEGVILALFADVLAMELRLSVTDAPGAALGRGKLPRTPLPGRGPALEDPQPGHSAACHVAAASGVRTP